MTEKGKVRDLQAKRVKRDERADMDLLAQTFVGDPLAAHREQMLQSASQVIATCEQVIIIGVVGGDVVDLRIMAPTTPIEGAGILTRAAGRFDKYAQMLTEDE